MMLLNSISLNMVAAFPATIHVEEIPLVRARELATDHLSAVGHADTAAVFGEQLVMPVQPNRVNVSLKSGDMVLVGQYRGPRLPEGATTLPEGATIQWLLVTVE